jgi:CRISPR-associated endonuclease Cas1|tara:strand:- start:210 stop:1256 length:1047 start_codon:yes stop_codon:yes gene_type:complete
MRSRADRDMEIDALQHPDFIWTWKSANRRGKVSLWLPYLDKIERLPKGKSDRYCFSFNGGAVTCHLKELDFIMLYGASGNIPVEFLDKLATYRIPMMIHRRNMPRPYIFYPEAGVDDKDLLTAQIVTRENLIKRSYVARMLIHARFKKFEKLIPIPTSEYHRLASCRTIASIRSIEARVTRRYWKKYFNEIGCPGVQRRDNSHLVNNALDAGSFFLYGIFLRWLLFHKFSPNHGFLHEPTSYPSLCYDLIEPFRYIIEESVASAAETSSLSGKENTAIALQFIKSSLEQEVYVPVTRQVVSRKNLLHGVVLALRAYLLSETKRFVIPIEGEKKGGRPPKVSYILPGGR